MKSQRIVYYYCIRIVRIEIGLVSRCNRCIFWIFCKFVHIWFDIRRWQNKTNTKYNVISTEKWEWRQKRSERKIYYQSHNFYCALYPSIAFGVAIYFTERIFRVVPMLSILLYTYLSRRRYSNWTTSKLICRFTWTRWIFPREKCHFIHCFYYHHHRFQMIHRDWMPVEMPMVAVPCSR